MLSFICNKMFKSGKKTKAPLDFTTVSEGNPSQPRVTVTSICAGHSLGSQYGEGGKGMRGALITTTPFPFHLFSEKNWKLETPSDPSEDFQNREETQMPSSLIEGVWHCLTSMKIWSRQCCPFCKCTIEISSNKNKSVLMEKWNNCLLNLPSALEFPDSFLLLTACT